MNIHFRNKNLNSSNIPNGLKLITGISNYKLSQNRYFQNNSSSQLCITKFLSAWNYSNIEIHRATKTQWSNAITKSSPIIGSLWSNQSPNQRRQINIMGRSIILVLKYYKYYHLWFAEDDTSLLLDSHNLLGIRSLVKKLLAVPRSFVVFSSSFLSARNFAKREPFTPLMLSSAGNFGISSKGSVLGYRGGINAHTEERCSFGFSSSSKMVTSRISGEKKKKGSSEIFSS